MGVEDHFYTTHASEETEWDKMADKNTYFFSASLSCVEIECGPSLRDAKKN